MILSWNGSGGRYTQEKASKDIADMKARKNELGKNLNTRAMSVLSQVEEQVSFAEILLIFIALSVSEMFYRWWDCNRRKIKLR